jgi:hypothetical protein
MGAWYDLGRAESFYVRSRRQRLPGQRKSKGYLTWIEVIGELAPTKIPTVVVVGSAC